MNIKDIVYSTVFDSGYVTEYLGFNVDIPHERTYTQYGKEIIEGTYEVVGTSVKESFDLGKLLSKLNKAEDSDEEYEIVTEYILEFLETVKSSLEKAIENRKNFEEDLSIVKNRLDRLKYRAKGKVCPHIEITSKDGKIRVSHVDKDGGSVTIL